MAPPLPKKAKTDNTTAAGHILDRDSLVKSDDSTDSIIPVDEPENDTSDEDHGVEHSDNDVEVQPEPTLPPVATKRKRGPKPKNAQADEGTPSLS